MFKKIKKSILYLLVLALVIPILLVTPKEVIASNEERLISKSKQEDVINIIKPYVEVTERGEIKFKDVPQKIYKKYKLSELQKHFNNLNELVKNDTIVIKKDLSIQDNSISLYSVHGKWTYYWWGYDRRFNDSEAKDFAWYLDDLSEGASIITGLTSWLPPVPGVAFLTSAYYSLLSQRVIANNVGRGVYVAISWSLLFDIQSL